MLNVTFYGVRGSTPCCGPTVQRYGGNTSCVAVEVPGKPPITLDMGTGLRAFGLTQPLDGSFHGTSLVTHLHWDHVQGLPFFVPVLKPGSRLDVYAPEQDDGRSVFEAFDLCIRPPFFPIDLSKFAGELAFYACLDSSFEVAGGAEVTSRIVPHVGPTVGYRIDWQGVSIAYISDHQMPYDGSHSTTDGVLELVDGVDLLIHDAQYTVAEFKDKFYWGHCTTEFAIYVAKMGHAKRLALYHHDPVRDDDALDEITACARRLVGPGGPEIITAAQGLTVSFD